MRYLVIGNVAIIATRGLEQIEDNTLTVTTQGIPAGVTICLHKGNLNKWYKTDIGHKAKIPLSDLDGAGRYAVTIAWEEKDPNTKAVIHREATANDFDIIEVDGSLCVTPSRGHTEAEFDMMWTAIVQTMENVVPFVEQYRYGNDVV
jgi:hypothetical protein